MTTSDARKRAQEAAEARAALAGREPSEAEVEAAVDALLSTDGMTPRDDEGREFHLPAENAEYIALAVLRAAADVRAKQEASALDALKTHLADMMTVSDAALARAKAAEKRVKEYENSVKPERDALRDQVAAVAALADEYEARWADTRERHPDSNVLQHGSAVVAQLRARLTDADSALRGVRAEAWDLGHATGSHDVVNRQLWDHPPTPNPYREQEEA